MAAKTFTCNVCQATVTKPQSYSYKEGRACRTHPEVLSAHEASEKGKLDNIEQHKNKARTHRFGSVAAHDFHIRNPNEYCWCCKKDGLYHHLMAERLLINMSKAELQGNPINLFDRNSPHFKMTRDDIGDQIPLKRFPINETYPDWKLKQILQGDLDNLPLVRTVEILVLCFDCAQKFEFDWNYDRPDFTPGLNLEKMALLGAIIKPAVDEIASQEIQLQDQQRDAKIDQEKADLRESISEVTIPQPSDRSRL